MVDFISNFLPPSLGRGLICFGEVGNCVPSWHESRYVLTSYGNPTEFVRDWFPQPPLQCWVTRWPSSGQWARKRRLLGGSGKWFPSYERDKRRRELVGALLLLVPMWDFWLQRKGQENHKCQTRALAPSWGFTWPDWGTKIPQAEWHSQKKPQNYDKYVLNQGCTFTFGGRVNL